MPELPSTDRLHEALSYDPQTGAFTWRSTGKVAGFTAKDGYRQITLDYRRLPAHRLAWVYQHGAWPTGEIDHVNGKRADNRIANLREVTRRGNSHNIPPGGQRPNKSGFPGVVFHRASGGRWRAQITVAGKSHYLGIYATPEEASAAYVAAKRRLHPEWVEAPTLRSPIG